MQKFLFYSSLAASLIAAQTQAQEAPAVSAPTFSTAGGTAPPVAEFSPPFNAHAGGQISEIAQIGLRAGSGPGLYNFTATVRYGAGLTPTTAGATFGGFDIVTGVWDRNAGTVTTNADADLLNTASDEFQGSLSHDGLALVYDKGAPNSAHLASRAATGMAFQTTDEVSIAGATAGAYIDPQFVQIELADGSIQEGIYWVNGPGELEMVEVTNRVHPVSTAGNLTFGPSYVAALEPFGNSYLPNVGAFNFNHSPTSVDDANGIARGLIHSCFFSTSSSDGHFSASPLIGAPSALGSSINAPYSYGDNNSRELWGSDETAGAGLGSSSWFANPGQIPGTGETFWAEAPGAAYGPIAEVSGFLATSGRAGVGGTVTLYAFMPSSNPGVAMFLSLAGDAATTNAAQGLGALAATVGLQAAGDAAFPLNAASAPFFSGGEYSTTLPIPAGLSLEGQWLSLDFSGSVNGSGVPSLYFSNPFDIRS